MQNYSWLGVTLLSLLLPAAVQGEVNKQADDAVLASGNTALIKIDHFQILGNTLLQPTFIEQLLAPYTGKNRSYADIQRALETLENAYHRAGYSSVHVYTPEQEVANGVITFRVLEASIGKVIISGNQFYDQENIRNALPALRERFTPSTRKISENVRLANENSSRQLDVVLAMGDQENIIDAKVNVQDSSPRKLLLTMDNTGNRNTGVLRTGIGFQHNNLFNRDQALTLNYVTSPFHVDDVKQISASYRLPIYSIGDSIDLIVAHSNTNAGVTNTVAGPLAFSGKGHIYSARYNHYFPRQGDYSAKLIAGLDYRAYDNSCSVGTFGAAGCGSAAFDITVHPASVSYNGMLTKPTMVSDFTATLLRNIVGGAHGSEADFKAVRPSTTGGMGAPADYTILRLNGSAAGVLPAAWQYRVAANVQYTKDALVSGESFGLVGANAVRGFLEREFNSDKGYVFNVEAYTPDFANKLGLNNGSIRLVGFVDRASGWNQQLAGENTQRITANSVGVGLRFNHSKNLAIKLDIARVNQISGNTPTDTSTQAGDRRGHVMLVGSW